MMKITVLGIDLAKNVFQLHGIDEKGRAVLKKRLPRDKLLPFIVNVPLCTIVMESCASANYWARKFKQYGHYIKLIAPQYVKPYVKTNKNDYNDAAAIVEAATRPHMVFVPIKNIEQQDVQCLHRVRQQLIRNRTALVNQIRGLLSEYGIITSQGIQHIRKQLPFIIEDAENELTVLSRELFSELYADLVALDKRITNLEKKIQQIYKMHGSCQRIGQIEGIGPITATAIFAAVNDITVFKNGRHLAAWLGLVPKQHSSGNRTILSGISKRGDSYVRSLLIHGARSIVKLCETKTDKRNQWVADKKKRCGFNKACVALANKNARIIWALLAKEENYQKAA